MRKLLLVFLLLQIGLFAQLSNTNIWMMRGDTKTLSFNYNGNILNDSLIFVVKSSKEITAVRLISKTTYNNQINILFGVSSFVYVRLDAGDTDDLTLAKYYYDITRIHNGDSTTIFIGELNLQPDIGTPFDGTDVTGRVTTVSLANGSINRELVWWNDSLNFWEPSGVTVSSAGSVGDADSLGGVPASEYLVKSDSTAQRTFSNLKYANKQSKIVYVADLRTTYPSETDQELLERAITEVSTNGAIHFERGRIYNQTDGLKLNLADGLTIYGNGATLKRGAQQVTTLTDTVSQYTTVLHVASIPTGWEIGDELQIYTDSTVSTSSRVVEILSINGLDITLKARVNTNANLVAMVWNVGDKVRKTYGQIVGAVEYEHHIYDLTFDGNKAENNGNYYWAMNEAVWLFKKSIIDGCRFINIPNENIFGNGFNITNCYAQDLNGSFVHQTGLNTYDIDNYYGTVSNCMTYNTNIMSSSTITGHSEGVITHSATAGRMNIHNNYFLKGGGAVMGYFAYGTDPDGSIKDFIFTDNFCRGFSSITALLYYNYSPNVPGHFVITNNVFDSCGTNDWEQYALLLSLYDSIYIAGNQLWGGTTWDNLPIYTNIQQSFQTGDIITEDITANDITSTGVTIANGDLYVWDSSVLGDEMYTTANAISDTNGTEANATLGWYALSTGTVAVEGTDVQTGTYALKFTVANNQSVEGMRDTLTGFGVGQTYKISLWAKAGTTADTISQKITGWVGFDESPNEYVTDEWAQYVYYPTATNDTVIIAAYGSTLGIAYGGSTGDEILIDNLSIQKVAGGDVIARGNFGYGNYYFENTPVSANYVPKTDANGVVTWQPDVAVTGTGTFTIDGVWIDTTAAGLATVTQAVKDTIALVKTKLTASDTTNFRTFSDLKYAATASFAIAPALLDDSLTVKMNRSEMTGYSTTSHTHTDFFDTLTITWGVLDTTYTGSLSGWKVPNDITITEISAYTDANTVTFNLEERAETTPNSAGTDVMGSDLVADTDQEETSTFTNATISKNTWLVPTISATGDVSIFTISVRYIKTD